MKSPIVLFDLDGTLAQTEVKAMLDMSQVFWTENLYKFPFHLYPGTLEVLQTLKTRGYRCFISSNCGIQYLNSLVGETGLEPIMDGAVCRGMHPELEKWEFTRQFLSELNYAEGWFVGDSYHDMEAGRHNGLKTIFAEYGYAQCENEALIDHRISAVQGLLDLL